MRHGGLGIWLGAVVTLLGFIVSAVGVTSTVRDRSARRRGRGAKGIVVDQVVTHDRKGRTFFPVFEFRTDRDGLVRARSAYGSGKPAHKVGDEVAVYYDPRDPQHAEIAGEDHGFTVMALVVGGIFAAIGIVCIAPTW